MKVSKYRKLIFGKDTMEAERNCKECGSIQNLSKDLNDKLLYWVCCSCNNVEKSKCEEMM